MQNDSAPAAVNFINLLFIAISLHIGVPWRDSVSAAVQHCCVSVRAPEVRRKRSDSTLRHLVRGGLPQRVTVGGKEGPISHCHGRLPKIVSTPIADVFRSAKPRPMLCHIVTGLRHLLLRGALMRVSQASVAEMLQRLAGWRPDAIHFGSVSNPRPPMSAQAWKRRAPSRLRPLNCPSKKQQGYHGKHSKGRRHACHA